jgi:hypothetical protein
MKYKVTGQLPKEQPVILGVVNTQLEVSEILEEYETTFPKITLLVYTGEFKKEITHAKKVALANLMHVLRSPMTNLLTNLVNTQR